MRLIDGDKLIDIITNSVDLGGVWGQVLKAVKDAFIRLIRTMPNVNPEPQWISVSERLPEEGTEVFVYLFNNPKSPYIAWIEDSRWYTEEFEVDREHEPLAWMPLPEPARLENV